MLGVSLVIRWRRKARKATAANPVPNMATEAGCGMAVEKTPKDELVELKLFRSPLALIDRSPDAGRKSRKLDGPAMKLGER